MSKSAYQLYMREIENIPPLSKKVEYIYFAAWRENGKEAARQKIYNSNLRFVAMTAQKYNGQGVPLIDLISEGNFALDLAMKRFDYTRGLKFISYAVWHIRQAILELLARQSRFVSITGAEAFEKANLNKERRRLTQRFGREPTQREMVKHTKFSEETVKRMEQMLEPYSVQSLDRPISIGRSAQSKKETLHNIIRDDKFKEPSDIDNKTKSMLEFLGQAGLNKQEVNVITSYYGINRHPRTLEEIRFDYGHTRERMRQIKEHALELLRKFDKRSKKFNLTNALKD